MSYTPTPEAAPNSKAHLRLEFIEMMFALAIAQVGIEIGEFYSNGLLIQNHMYVATQLILATYIIASSWVGWYTSKSKGQDDALTSTFGLPFFILLIDLFLVICYFILARTVEEPYRQDFEISAKPEIFWSQFILGSYILWDIVTKLVVVRDPVNIKLGIEWKPYSKRAFQAIICYLIVLFFLAPHKGTTDPTKVAIIDTILLFVFMLFRGSKRIFSIREEPGDSQAKTVRYFVSIVFPILALAFFITLLKKLC
ncbi:MAG: hypothetical protein ACI9JN_000393 [Bacteroidia bacterium]|jgi:hypothetical protein